MYYEAEGNLAVLRINCMVFHSRNFMNKLQLCTGVLSTGYPHNLVDQASKLAI